MIDKRRIFALAVSLLLGLLTGCSKEAKVQADSPGAATAKQDIAKTDSSAMQVTLTRAAQQQTGLQTAEVHSEVVDLPLSVPGQLLLNEERTLHVGAIAMGRVVKVNAQLGDTVQAGQMLAQLHSHDVHDSRAAYLLAKAELEQMKSNLSLAQRTRDRLRRLLALKSASQEQVDQAETAYLNAQQNVIKAEAAVAREKAHLEEFLGVVAEESEQAAQTVDEQDYIAIKAPSAGTIVMRKVGPGSVVNAGDETFTISDLSSLWVNAAVNESDLGRIRIGAAVRAEVKAMPGQFLPGRILRLGEQVDPVTRTLAVRILLPNPSQRLRPDMYATVEIPGVGVHPALFVPAPAVQEMNGQRVVFLKTGPEQFTVAAVETGLTRGEQIEIRNGLMAGQTVVTKGSFVLKSELLKKSLAEE